MIKLLSKIALIVAVVNIPALAALAGVNDMANPSYRMTGQDCVDLMDHVGPAYKNAFANSSSPSSDGDKKIAAKYIADAVAFTEFLCLVSAAKGETVAQFKTRSAIVSSALSQNAP